MSKRLTNKRKVAIRDVAMERVRHYSAVLAMHDDAPIVKYDKKHLDPTLTPSPGYLVQAWVFVSDEDLEDIESS